MKYTKRKIKSNTNHFLSEQKFQILFGKYTENYGFPEGITNEPQLWDAIFKSLITTIPKLLFPLIKESFQEEFPRGSTIHFDQTEYPVRMTDGSITMIRNDATFYIEIPCSNRFPVYHYEAQIKNDSTICPRLFEYDTQIALAQFRQKSISYSKVNNQSISFPSSAVLYLTSTSNTPDYHVYHLTFPNGQQIRYHFPVIKVYDYMEPDILFQKNLELFIPFLPLQFKNRLGRKSYKKKLTVKELTQYLKKIIINLQKKEERGLFTHYEILHITDCLCKAIVRIFYHHQNFMKEALAMTSPILTTVVDELNDLRVLTQNLNLTNQNLNLRNQQLENEILITKLAYKGFSPDDIAKQQNFSLDEVLKILNDC